MSDYAVEVRDLHKHFGHVHALQELRHLARQHVLRVRARRVQERAAGTVHRAHHGFVQRDHPLRVFLRGRIGVVIQQAAPPSADAVDLMTGVHRAIHDLLDARVQARNVTATRKHTNTQHPKTSSN